jgi:hypothetical protein
MSNLTCWYVHIKVFPQRLIRGCRNFTFHKLQHVKQPRGSASEILNLESRILNLEVSPEAEIPHAARSLSLDSTKANSTIAKQSNSRIIWQAFLHLLSLIPYYLSLVTSSRDVLKCAFSPVPEGGRRGFDRPNALKSRPKPVKTRQSRHIRAGVMLVTCGKPRGKIQEPLSNSKKVLCAARKPTVTGTITERSPDIPYIYRE